VGVKWLLIPLFQSLTGGCFYLCKKELALQACGYNSVSAEFARGLSKFAMRKKGEVLKNDFVFCGFYIWKYDKIDLKCYIVVIS